MTLKIPWTLSQERKGDGINSWLRGVEEQQSSCDGLTVSGWEGDEQERSMDDHGHSTPFAFLLFCTFSSTFTAFVFVISLCDLNFYYDYFIDKEAEM